MEIGRDFSTLLITGPNTGGKTVALKTIGLLALMAQAGLPIPAAEESVIPILDNIFPDIGDEQSIEQTLSTFSWHMGNIVSIIRKSTPNSMVLLDELGTSTDPAEGSALARAVMHHFLRRGVLTVATTHFGDLKAFAHTTPGMQNASFDFDPKTLAPTYHMTMGIPGGSNALATAQRLGLPPKIIEEARQLLTGGGEAVDAMLTDLMAEKQKAGKLSSELAAAKKEVEEKRAQVDAELQRLHDERQRLMREVRDQVVQEASELHKEIKRAETELRRERKKESIDRAKKDLASVRERLAGDKWLPAEAEAGVEETPIATGDTVWLRDINMEATVLVVSSDSSQVDVQAGPAKIRLGIEGVQKVKPAAPEPKTITTGTSRVATRGVSCELDLRGRRADEVEPLLDSYLNDASLSNLGEARIIHGMGTGVVREIVRTFLARHPLARSWRAGGDKEGGDGVTIASL
jgi:DNA mismatch repair protein MutS2